MVESCLAKDPSKRPTADQLLRTSFFRNVKKKSYLINSILSKLQTSFLSVLPKLSIPPEDLPPLTNRQEKRVRPNSQIHHSVDSWDFTVHSVPVSPLSPTKWRGSLETTLEPNTVFEIEDEFDPPKQVDSHSYPLGTGTSSLSKDPSANEHERLSIPRHQVAPVLKDTDVTVVPDPMTASDKTLPAVIRPVSGSATLLDPISKTMPIPISKPATSSSMLRPVTPQDDLLSASPASAMSSSLSSHASSLFTKDKISSSSSSSLSFPSQGRLWNKIKSKTSTKVRRATSPTKLQATS